MDTTWHRVYWSVLARLKARPEVDFTVGADQFRVEKLTMGYALWRLTETGPVFAGRAWTLYPLITGLYWQREEMSTHGSTGDGYGAPAEPARGR